eukprot:2107043-Rhodomonas_salina.8
MVQLPCLYACWAPGGTALAYGAQAVCGTEIACGATRCCSESRSTQVAPLSAYALHRMSGTHVADGASAYARPMQCPVPR